MWDRSYDVTMQTPIGARYGTMTVCVAHRTIHGMLNILKKASPFQGTIDETGRCRISGALTTLTRTIPYTGTGQVTQTALSFLLTGERERFVLSGTARAGAETERDV